MKIVFQIILSFTLVGCSTIRQISIHKLEGKFQWSDDYGVGETIEINSDLTFKFSWAQGLMYGETKGSFKKVGNYWELNSEYQPDLQKFHLEIPPQTKQVFYEVLVTDIHSNGLAGSHCKSYKEGNFIDGMFSDEWGICRFSNTNIDSLAFDYLGYNEAGIKVESGKTPKTMIIRLKEDKHYHYFKEQKIKVLNYDKIELKTFFREKIFVKMKKK